MLIAENIPGPRLKHRNLDVGCVLALPRKSLWGWDEGTLISYLGTECFNGVPFCVLKITFLEL